MVIFGYPSAYAAALVASSRVTSYTHSHTKRCPQRISSLPHTHNKLYILQRTPVPLSLFAVLPAHTRIALVHLTLTRATILVVSTTISPSSPRLVVPAKRAMFRRYAAEAGRLSYIDASVLRVTNPYCTLVRISCIS